MSSRSYRPPPSQQEPSRNTSSIRRPAVHESESDLFGHRPSQSAPPPSAGARSPSMPPPVSSVQLGGPMMIDAPPPSFSKGARDENSVLFSVKDLVHAAAVRKSNAPPAAEAVPFGNDPTGLVDLHAIALNTHSSLEVKPLDIANLRPSVVPMPIPQPSLWGGGTEEEPKGLDKLVALAKGPRAPLLFAGIGVVALLFVGFGAMLTAWALSDSGNDLAASIAAPVPADDGVIEREVVQRTKVAETPVAAATPGATASGRRHGSGKAAASFGKSSSKSSSSSKSTPKKASDPCNCHGQLACAMRCTK